MPDGGKNSMQNVEKCDDEFWSWYEELDDHDLHHLKGK